MSRGLGRIERAILDAFEKQATDLSDEDREVGIDRNVPMTNSLDLLLKIHGGVEALLQDGKLRAKYNAMTRALRSLERKGLIQSFRYEGRTIWTDAQGAQQLEELHDELNRQGTGWMERLTQPSAEGD